MKKFGYLLNKAKVMLITFTIVFFFLGYFITDIGYNNNFATYDYSFTTTENMSKLQDVSYYKETFKKIDEHNADMNNKYISYAKIDYEQMVNDLTFTQEGNLVTISIPKKHFTNIVRTSNGLVNEGINRVQKYYKTILNFNGEDYNEPSATLSGEVNPFMVGGITCAISLVLMLSLFAYLAYKNKDIEVKDIHDNKTIFNSPFHKEYWKQSIGFLRSPKNIATIASLFALMLICKFIPIPSGFGGLGLGFTYLFFAIISSIYGPVAGLMIGLISDNIGYLIKMDGPYFPGYTITAMLSGFIYGLCFFRTKITFTKCLTCRLIINMIINSILGSYWWKVIYDLDINGFISYMTLISIPKNIIYLLPQTIVLYLVFKAVKSPLKRFGLYDPLVADNITLF